MPKRYPDDFRHCAIELARSGDKPVAHVAADLGIATSCPRRWMKQRFSSVFDLHLSRNAIPVSKD